MGAIAALLFLVGVFALIASWGRLRMGIMLCIVASISLFSWFAAME